MRKIPLKCIFLAVSLFIMPVFLHGQATRVSIYSMNDDVVKTIIREYTFPISISYVETTTSHMFIHNDGNNHLIMVPINSNYSVNDFVIDGPYVCFCGETSKGAGFFGEFLLNDFFFNNQSYEITSSSMYSQSNNLVTTLSKMCAYTTNTAREMVAIGHTSSGQECVVELRNTANSWQCRVGELGLLNNEQLLDITVTKDYVVTGGVSYWGQDYPCFRKYDKNDIFSISGIQDRVSVFSANNPLYNYFFDPRQMVLGSTWNSNYFYVGAYWRASSTQYTYLYPRGLHVGIYEVNPVFDSIIIYRSAEIPLPYQNGGWKLRGITSHTMYGTDSFFLLQDAEYEALYPLQSMVLELSYTILNSVPLLPTPPLPPPSPSLLIPVRVSTDSRYFSIDAFNNNEQYVMNGIRMNDNQSLMFYDRYNSINNHCMVDGMFWCYKFDKDSKKELIAFSVNDTPMTMNSHTGGQPVARSSTMYCPTKEDSITNQNEER